MSGQSSLYFIAFGVAIFVILGITITFSVLFFLYSLYKRKYIRIGAEDDKIIYELVRGYIKENRKRKKEEKLTCHEYFDFDRARTKKFHTVCDVASGIVIAILLVLLGIGLTFNLSNNQVFIGNSTYLTVMTSSMETKYADNKYLEENDLNNQIQQYSLIKVDKVESIDDLKQYDVIAFKDSDGTIIVHRIVSIYDGATDSFESTLAGTTYIKTKGDANPGYLSDEYAITFDQVIGIYSGSYNYVLGVFIIYFKSNIGIITLVFAAFFLFLATWALELITKEYNKRIEYLFNNNLICESFNVNELMDYSFKDIKKIIENSRRGIPTNDVNGYRGRALIQSIYPGHVEVYYSDIQGRK